MDAERLNYIKNNWKEIPIPNNPTKERFYYDKGTLIGVLDEPPPTIIYTSSKISGTLEGLAKELQIEWWHMSSKNP